MGVILVVSFEKDGFTALGGTKGRTYLIEDEKGFKLLTGPVSHPEDVYMLGYVQQAELKKSFDAKKKVILIAITGQFLNPESYVLDKAYLTKIKNDKNTSVYKKWWDNVKIEATHALIHELIAHGIHHIKGDSKPPKIEHKNYSGVESDFSPNIREVLNDETGKYGKTVMLKAINQIQSSIQKLHRGKK